MDKKNIELLNNITFKTHSYRKNFDFINDGENIITEYDGNVSELRIDNLLPPIIIGEYGFSIWNLDLGNKLNIDIDLLIMAHHFEDTYKELINNINCNDLNTIGIKKLVLIHTFILQKKYRKNQITEEFIEMIYREFYNDDTIIIALVKPFQYNVIDADYYLNKKIVKIKQSVKSDNYVTYSANEYYSLDEFINKTDAETNEYKLFGVASKCGFKRINESYLFKFSPEITINRILSKYNKLEINQIDNY